MTVDIVSLLVFAFLVFLGWRSGAVRQVLRVVAVVGVIAGAPFLSPVVREVVFEEPGRASPGIEVASIVIAGILIYIAVALAGWAVIKVMRLVSSTLDVLDRVGGATIGALKAAIIIYLFAMAVVFLEGPITERDPDNELGLRDGMVTGFVGDYDVLAPWQFPDLSRLHRAIRVGDRARKEEVYEVVRQREEAAAVMRDERVEGILGDDQLMEWIREDHYPMTLADARVRKLLNDEDFAEKLSAVDWRHLEGRIEEAASE